MMVGATDCLPIYSVQSGCAHQIDLPKHSAGLGMDHIRLLKACILTWIMVTTAVMLSTASELIESTNILK